MSEIAEPPVFTELVIAEDGSEVLGGEVASSAFMADYYLSMYIFLSSALGI